MRTKHKLKIMIQIIKLQSAKFKWKSSDFNFKPVLREECDLKLINQV